MELQFIREFRRRCGSVFIGELRENLSWCYVFVKFSPFEADNTAHQEAENECIVLLSLQRIAWVPRVRFLQRRERGLYLGSELLMGGDLMMHLETMGKCEAQAARCVLSQLLSSIDSMHKLGWIHRKIRPENIVFDDSGKLVLVNFTKSHRIGVRADCVGCEVDYLAPEVLQDETYSESVDVWSIGIILYEMMCGGPPFSDEERDRNKTIYRIINHDKYLWFPAGHDQIPDSAVDFIKYVLQPRHKRPSVSELKKHPFLAPVDWDNLQPFQPNLKSRLTSIFSG